MSTMPFTQAYQVSIATNYFRQTHNIVSNFEKAKIEALVHHNGRLHDGTGAIKFILEMSVSDRFKYLYHLLKNPTVDLTANENYLAKKLVNDGDNHAISVLLNNPKIDLSFDGNHLLKIASSRNDIDMVHLLLQDMNVKRIIGLDVQSDDDDLESLSSYHGNEDQDQAIHNYILNSANTEITAQTSDTDENEPSLVHESENMDEDESAHSKTQPPIASLTFNREELSSVDSLTDFSEEESKSSVYSKDDANIDSSDRDAKDDAKLPASEDVEWLQDNSAFTDPKSHDEDYDWIDNDPDWETLGSEEESSGMKEIKNLLTLVGRYWKDKR